MQPTSASRLSSDHRHPPVTLRDANISVAWQLFWVRAPRGSMSKETLQELVARLRSELAQPHTLDEPTRRALHELAHALEVAVTQPAGLESGPIRALSGSFRGPVAPTRSIAPETRYDVGEYCRHAGLLRPVVRGALSPQPGCSCCRCGGGWKVGWESRPWGIRGRPTGRFEAVGFGVVRPRCDPLVSKTFTWPASGCASGLTRRCSRQAPLGGVQLSAEFCGGSRER